MTVCVDARSETSGLTFWTLQHVHTQVKGAFQMHNVKKPWEVIECSAKTGVGLEQIWTTAISYILEGWAAAAKGRK